MRLIVQSNGFERKTNIMSRKMIIRLCFHLTKPEHVKNDNGVKVLLILAQRICIILEFTLLNFRETFFCISLDAAKGARDTRHRCCTNTVIH